MKRYLMAGRLCSPRGIKGELRFECWCDSPGFLSGVKEYYLKPDGTEKLTVELYRESIPSLTFIGYPDRGSAAALTNRTIYFDREDKSLAQDVVYNDDLLRLDVFDESGKPIGKIAEVIDGVRNFLYVVELPDGRRVTLPAVDEFILKITPGEGVYVRLPDGLESI